ncbi:hypothetical protein D3C83_107210 [compost metagenome]
MADHSPKLLDVVALLRDLPEFNLARGQVGTIVDETDEASVLVEFADADGREYAMPTVRRADLLVLAYEPEGAK